MIIKETVEINGKQFNKTYSNHNKLIERDGVQYSEAIDPIDVNRVYTETNTPIERDGETDSNQATEQDYQNALTEMGVKLND